MISYHDQCIKPYTPRMISYQNLCVRLILNTWVFHSKHNCLNISQYVLFIKQNTKSWIQIQILLLISVTIIICFHWYCELCYYHNTLFYQYISIYRTIFSYFCDISYPYDFGHSLVRSENTSLATEFWYELARIDHNSHLEQNRDH